MSKIKEFLANNPVLGRLYKNASVVMSGNLLSAFISFLCVVVLARATSLDSFGQFAVISAYVALVDRLAGFQTWQALIHFGAGAICDPKQGNAFSLFAFGGLLDVFSGVVGLICGYIGVYFFADKFHLNDVDKNILLLCLFVLVFNWSATPIAIFRLFDKFHHQVISQNIIAFTKLVGFLLLWLLGVKGLNLYLLVWGIANILGRVYMPVMAIIIFTKEMKDHVFKLDFKGLFQRYPNLIGFVLTTNVDGIVRVLRDIDVLIVNAVLGNAITGLYRISRDLAKIATQITGPFYQVIYPELAKLATTEDWHTFKRIIKHSSLTIGGIVMLGWVCYIVVGEHFINIVYGSDYSDAYPIAFWCIGAVAVWAFAQPLAPAMLSLGKAKTNLYVNKLTSVFYVVVLFYLSQQYGAVGAGFTLFVFYVFWSSCMLGVFLFSIKKEEKNEF